MMWNILKSMGWDSMPIQIQSLPLAEKTYTPKSDLNKDQIDKTFKEISEKIPDSSQVLKSIAGIAGNPTDFYKYINAAQSVVKLATSDDSIQKLDHLMDEKIDSTVASTLYDQIRAEIDTIKSRLQDANSESLKHSASVYAGSRCEYVMTLFQNQNSILYKLAIRSSPILFDAWPICAQVYKYNYEMDSTSYDRSLKNKNQLIGNLKQYESKCIHDRLGFVTIQTRDNYVGQSLIPTSFTREYKLNDAHFKKDQSLPPMNICQDQWQGWRKENVTYEDLVQYRKSLENLYMADFEDAIKRAFALLDGIKEEGDAKKVRL